MKPTLFLHYFLVNRDHQQLKRIWARGVGDSGRRESVTSFMLNMNQGAYETKQDSKILYELKKKKKETDIYYVNIKTMLYPTYYCN